MKKITLALILSLLILAPFVVKADLTSDYNNQHNALEQQIIDIKTQYYKDVTAIQGSAGFLEQQNGLIQKATNEANAKIQQIQLQEQQLYLNYQNALNSQQAQQPICPANSYLSGNQCACNAGYVASGNACITYGQSCQNQYGSNSYGDKNNCYCSVGYQWNAGQTSCVAITCPNNSSLIGDQCLCNNGYIQSGDSCITYTQDCTNNFGQNVVGMKGNNGTSSCNCGAGYEWNPSQTACVMIPASATQSPVPNPIVKTITPTTAKASPEKVLGQDKIVVQQGNSKNQSTVTKSVENSDAPKTSLLNKVFNSIKKFFGGLFK